MPLDEPSTQKTLLIATNVPEGMVVHVELGIIGNRTQFIAALYKEKDLPYSRPQETKLLEKLTSLGAWSLVHAKDVGLQWHDKSGKKIEVSDKWAEQSWIIVSEKKISEGTAN